MVMGWERGVDRNGEPRGLKAEPQDGQLCAEGPFQGFLRYHSLSGQEKRGSCHLTSGRGCITRDTGDCLKLQMLLGLGEGHGCPVLAPHRAVRAPKDNRPRKEVT